MIPLVAFVLVLRVLGLLAVVPMEGEVVAANVLVDGKAGLEVDLLV